jgi:outer membrane lipoprotein LolB
MGALAKTPAFRRRVLPACAIAFLLAGCATTRPAPTCRYDKELAGRLNVAYSKDGRDESMTGRFTWQQGADCTDIAIQAPPLNNIVATISVTPNQATLTENGKAPRSAADIDALSTQALGWTLPVSGLRDWLQGRATAAGGKAFTAAPAAGGASRSSVTTADGWQVTWVSWHDAAPGGQGAPLPKRIDAERGATGKLDHMSIRLILDAPQ